MDAEQTRGRNVRRTVTAALVLATVLAAGPVFAAASEDQRPARASVVLAGWWQVLRSQVSVVWGWVVPAGSAAKSGDTGESEGSAGTDLSERADPTVIRTTLTSSDEDGESEGSPHLDPSG